MEWFSWVVAVILLISSVISPWLVTKSNNSHQLKLKKLDMYEDYKRKALSNFIECAQKVIFNSSDLELLTQYSSSFDELFIYFNNINLSTIKNFDIARVVANKISSSENIQNANLELTKIVQDLSKQIAKE